MGIKNPIQYIHIIKLCSLVVERCKYGYLFLIMQIFIHYFANATVDGFDFLAGGCYHQDRIVKNKKLFNYGNIVFIYLGNLERDYNPLYHKDDR